MTGILSNSLIDNDNTLSYNDNMVRTQISLRSEDYKRAKDRAKALGISLAEYFRRALLESLPVETDKPWMRYAAMVESGKSYSNEEIDQLVYVSK